MTGAEAQGSALWSCRCVSHTGAGEGAGRHRQVKSSFSFGKGSPMGARICQSLAALPLGAGSALPHASSCAVSSLPKLLEALLQPWGRRAQQPAHASRASTTLVGPGTLASCSASAEAATRSLRSRSNHSLAVALPRHWARSCGCCPGAASPVPSHPSPGSRSAPRAGAQRRVRHRTSRRQRLPLLRPQKASALGGVGAKSAFLRPQAHGGRDCLH